MRISQPWESNVNKTKFTQAGVVYERNTELATANGFLSKRDRALKTEMEFY
jgi:hypothetical protein